MKITIGELLNVPQAFTDVVNKDLSIKVALKLRKMNAIIVEELKIIDPERIKIFEKHKVPLSKDNRYDTMKLKTKERSVFNKDWFEFSSQEIDLNCEPLKVEELGDIKVKPSSLILLEKFIKD